MLEQKDNSVIFYAHYIESKAGKTGLTVTVDVWEVQRDGTATEIVSAGNATEIGDGLYRYLLVAGSVDEEAEYIAVFKTADTSVDQRDLPAMWVIDRAGIERLVANQVADETLKRGISNVEDTADTTSLAALVLSKLESARSSVRHGLSARLTERRLSSKQ